MNLLARIASLVLVSSGLSVNPLSAQSWEAIDDLAHEPVATIDAQGFNFGSGAFCVVEPLSNFPEGVTRASLSFTICLPVVKGCDSGSTSTQCNVQVHGNRNDDVGSILHNSLSAVGLGRSRSFVTEITTNSWSVSAPFGSSLLASRYGNLVNSDGSDMKEAWGEDFVTRLRDAQDNFIGYVGAEGGLMTFDESPYGHLVISKFPDGEILRYYFERRQSTGTSKRIRHIVSSRGYGIHLSYRSNTASSALWLHPYKIWQYRTSEVSCGFATSANCGSALTSLPASTEFTYSGGGYILDIDTVFRPKRRLSFQAGPGGGTWADYNDYLDLVINRVEFVDVPGSIVSVEYTNPPISIGGCDRCEGGVSPYSPSRITTSDGQWLYSFQSENSPFLEDPSETWRTDPNGGKRFVSVAKGIGTVTETRDENNVIQKFGLGSYLRIARVDTTQAGVQVAPTVTMVRDLRGNITEQRLIPVGGSTADALVNTQTFPADCTFYRTCNRPTQIIDPNGSATNFTYDNAHGGMLTAMGPAPQSGGARPLLLITWGQRYAWDLGANGSLVRNSDPFWVKLSETNCQTTAGSSPSPACDQNGNVLVKSYEYGDDGTRESLFVKGVAVTADGQTLRTCYDYDEFGRKISETAPAASLSVCP